MKPIFLAGLMCLVLQKSICQIQPGFNDTSILAPVELIATRANEKTPVAKTTLLKPEIEKMNIGQDLPFILQQTASIVAHSDAGNGIGYTGLRIRGSDPSRINVTINGIPYNDAESQGSFFVDLPDIAASASSIQIQRGVGTSTNGSGAFGGSINVSTNEIVRKRSLHFMSNAGSYNSYRNTLSLNSGVVGKHFTFDGRVSDIRSNGYIERAATKLRSFYSSVAFLSREHTLRLNIFSGKEKTYQAWNGVSEPMLAANRRHNSAGTERLGSAYENETDNYTQTHYNLSYNAKPSSTIKTNVAVFLTRGKGYYEQYKASQGLAEYGLPDYISGPDTISITDLVRRLWLDNYFYGSVFSGQYERGKTTVTLGGAVSRYEGTHYGEIISAQQKNAIPADYRWYDVHADKNDLSGFVKWTQQVSKHWQSFVDVQLRAVQYDLFGFRNNPSLNISNRYSFINPKAGITYTNKKMTAYASYSRGSKEPNRDDFETGITQRPSPEYLDDYEAGVEYKSTRFKLGLGLYFMNYKDQLVLTGRINDVGAYTRTNVRHSFRGGIEISGSAWLRKWLSMGATLTLSKNKVRDFEEFLDDYDNGGQLVKSYPNSDLAFSPQVISSATIGIKPFRNGAIDLFSKYVSKQYLDNTENEQRKLAGYFVQDLRLSYTLELRRAASISFFIQGNNIFSELYEPNGYSFSYVSMGELTTENYYFPMAPINFMGGITIKL